MDVNTFVNPEKVSFSPPVTEMLRRCYAEELATFKELDRIPAALFRIIRCRFIIAGILIQQRNVYVDRSGRIVPEGTQVSVITKIVRRLCKENIL